jgi:hypothetical protein
MEYVEYGPGWLGATATDIAAGQFLGRDVYASNYGTADNFYPVAGGVVYRTRGDVRGCRPQPANDYMAQRQRAEQEYYDYMAQLERRSRAASEAAARADKLLLNWMKPSQRKSWEANGYFCVRSSKRRKWQILRGRTVGNVFLLSPRGHRLACYCAAVPGVPNADTYLTQALTLIADEDAFVRIANRM